MNGMMKVHKQDQKTWSIGFALFLVMCFILVWQISGKLAFSLLAGIGIGFVMQKSRFCFVAAFRDPFLVGLTHLSQAVILLLMISILGFFAVINLFNFLGWSYELYAFPVGFNTVAGGLLFGVGMVLAGACASGVLVRIGEGFVMQFLAFLGLIIGVILGEESVPFWQSRFGVWTEKTFLPDQIGWPLTLTLELAFLAFLWWAARQYQKYIERQD